jgi:HEAT repeat protein
LVNSYKYKYLNVKIRLNAVQALGRLGDKKQLPVVQNMLKGPDSSMRAAAIGAVARLGGKDEIPKLTPFLQDTSSEYTRIAAIRALVELRAPKVGDQFIELLRDPSPEVRKEAAKALGDLPPEGLAKKVASLLKGKPDEQIAALDALAYLKAKEQIPAITALLNNQPSGVVAAAAEALGRLLAHEQAGLLIALLKVPDDAIQVAAAEALGAMGAKQAAPALRQLLNDPKEGGFARLSAAEALGKLQAGEVKPDLIQLYQNPTDAHLRSGLGEALAQFGPLPLHDILAIMGTAYQPRARVEDVRWHAHYLSGGTQDAEILLSWLASPSNEPVVAGLTAARNMLDVFEKAWPLTEAQPRLRKDLAMQASAVIAQADWQPADKPVLQTWHSRAEIAGPPAPNRIQRALDALGRESPVEPASSEDWLRWVAFWILIGLLAHVVFWVYLLLVASSSLTVQKIFLWNRRVRVLLGLGYWELLFYYHTFARLVLRGLRHGVLPQPETDAVGGRSFAAGLLLKPLSSPEGQPSPETAAVRRAADIWGLGPGTLVLFGGPGQGKTAVLRLLAERSATPVTRWGLTPVPSITPRGPLAVYLLARECQDGVFCAIQKVIPVTARDPRFLRRLLYAGDIFLLIDDFDEADPTTRIRILDFPETSPRSTLLIATRPLPGWHPPSRAGTFVLQPLDQSQAALFVRSRALPEGAHLKESPYEAACDAFLKQATAEKAPEPAGTWWAEVLANPLDLTSVAELLARGETPNLYRLLQWQYEKVDKDFHQHTGRRFPTRAVSEHVYQARQEGRANLAYLPADQFAEEIQALQRHRIVMTVRAEGPSAPGAAEWRFRADRLADFCLAEALSPDRYPERYEAHRAEYSFQGVYYLLSLSGHGPAPAPPTPSADTTSSARDARLSEEERRRERDRLREEAERHRDEAVRIAALWGLVGAHADDPELLPLLDRLAREGHPEGIREAAAAVRLAVREKRVQLLRDWLNDALPDGHPFTPPPAVLGFPALAVRAVRLRNIRAFEDLPRLDFPSSEDHCTHPPALLLGDNAAGKSTLLRCLALAALGPELANQAEKRPDSYLRSGRTAGFIEVRFDMCLDAETPAVGASFCVGLKILEHQNSFQGMAHDEITLNREGEPRRNAAERLSGLRRRTDSQFGFVCGYGALRALSEAPSGLVTQDHKVALDRVLSLFSPGGWLFDPDVLGRMLGGDLSKFRSGPTSLNEEVRRELTLHLQQLLPESEIVRAESAPVVHLYGHPTRLRDLSDGYASFLALLGHLSGHGLAALNWGLDPTRVAGVLLVDELDLHLHPNWQRRVLTDLTRLFPRLQVIATSHSPLVAGSAPAESLVVFRRRGAAIKVLTGLKLATGLRADQILTSDLFGLPTSRDQATEEKLAEYAELLNRRGPDDDEVRARGREVAQALDLEGEGVVDRYTHELLKRVLDQQFADMDEPTRKEVLARAELLLADGDADDDPN